LGGGRVKRGLVQAALRLFAVQGCWNYDRMVGVGLGYAEEPLLRDLPGGPEGERYNAAMRRAAGYFNAHPYLVGLAAGAIARAEHDGVEGKKVERLRTALLGPLGSVGDRLVWAGTLPAASSAGLIVSAVGPVGAGAVVLLALHNVVHLVMRFWGLATGWRLGTGVAQALTVPTLVGALRVAGPVAAIVLGIAIPVTAAWVFDALDPAGDIAVAAMFVVTVVVGRWLVPTMRGVRLGLLAVLAVMLGSWL
jgi:mannose/fructose/N-acetylgalactosamine-specific phosphotransferase system component IID